MRRGVILLPSHDPEALAKRVYRAEGLGFDCVGIGDVPGSSGELYVALGELANLPLRIALGPMVTNPVVRPPLVTAAALAALHRRAPGRVFLGVGRGGSPLAELGVRRPDTTELERGVRAIRDGLERYDARVPVMLSAYGPKTLRLAGAAAAGAIIAGGASIDYIRRAVATVRAAAPDPGKVVIWLMVRVAIGESWGDAVRGIRSNLASAGANNLRGPAVLDALPADVREKLASLRRRYEGNAHTARDGANARLIDELGLTEFLADRFAVVGSPDAVRRRFEQYAELGVDAVFVPSADGDSDRFLDDLAAATQNGGSPSE